MIKKCVIAWLLCLLSFSIVARFWQLGSVPLGRYWDEVAIQADAWSLTQTAQTLHGKHWANLIYESYGDYKAPVFIWMTAVIMLVIGNSTIVVPAVGLLIGMANLVTAWLIGKKLSRLWQAQHLDLSLITIISLSPWWFHFSRVGFEAFLGQFLVMVAVWSLLNIWTAQKTRSSILFGIVGAVAVILSIWSYYSVRFVVIPVVMILSLGFVFTLRPFKKIQLKVLLSFCLIVAGMAAVWLVQLHPFYPASQQFRLSTESVLNLEGYVLESNLLRQVSGDTILDRVVYHRRVLQVKDLASNLSSHLSLDFLFITGDSQLRHGTGVHGVFLLPMIVLLGLGFYKLGTQQPVWLVVLVVWTVLGFIPASVPFEVPHALRSLNAALPLSLLLAVGLSFMLEHLANSSLIFLTSGWLLWLSAALMFYLSYYFLVYPTVSATNWQVPYQNIAQFLVEQPQPVVLLPFDDRFFLWLVATGKFEPEVIQSSLTAQQDSKLKQLDRFLFEANRSDLAAVLTSTWIVGSTQQIEEILDEYDWASSKTTTFENGFQAVLVTPI